MTSHTDETPVRELLRHGAPVCRRCSVPMRTGNALLSTTVAGSPDFAGDREGITISWGGPGRMVECWKCPRCGHSIT